MFTGFLAGSSASGPTPLILLQVCAAPDSHCGDWLRASMSYITAPGDVPPLPFLVMDHITVPGDVYRVPYWFLSIRPYSSYPATGMCRTRLPLW